MTLNDNGHVPRIIIIGAGFGGLFAARELRGQPIDVLLIDRNNYHTFTPLLYQVATCALDPSDVARPVRSIFHRAKNVQFLLGEVTEIDTENQIIEVQRDGRERREQYDYLILAGGSSPTYFGDDEFRTYSWELDTLIDAVRLRNHMLRLFEQATWADDPEQVKALTTIVVVGGGPTGLETAGAVYELYNHVLDQEYAQANLHTRVVLVEMLPYLLKPYPEELRQAALEQLRSLGVEVMLEKKVAAVDEDHVTLDDDTVLPTYTLIWAAGVGAASLGGQLEVELPKSGRIPIEPTTRVKGLDNVYAIGDISYLEDPEGEPYPMLIPVAQQQGRLAARNILADIAGKAPENFKYNDRGIMATIGRRRAVAYIYNRIPVTGWLAWLAWLGLHLVTLVGFRNRLNVLVNWIWNYFTYDRSVRIILERSPERQSASEPQTAE